MTYKRRFIEDDLIARQSLEFDVRQEQKLKFLKRIRQIFNVEKGCKILNLRQEGWDIACIEGRCSFPILYSDDEIQELLDDIEDKIKKREL